MNPAGYVRQIGTVSEASEASSRWFVPRLLAMALCPACGEDNPDRARFCLACGSALAETGVARRKERKVVLAERAFDSVRAVSLSAEARGVVERAHAVGS